MHGRSKRYLHCYNSFHTGLQRHFCSFAAPICNFASLHTSLVYVPICAVKLRMTGAYSNLGIIYTLHDWMNPLSFHTIHNTLLFCFIPYICISQWLNFIHIYSFMHLWSPNSAWKWARNAWQCWHHTTWCQTLMHDALMHGLALAALHTFMHHCLSNVGLFCLLSLLRWHGGKHCSVAQWTKRSNL